MKKVLIVLSLAVVMACGGKKETSETNAEEYVSQDSKPKASSADQIAEGEKLVAGSDCKTCHHKTNKLIGPSHTDVAKKYDFTADNVKTLANKIINGGQGVWGEIPMTAHVDVTVENAEKMARYVLSLDGETEH